MILIYVDESGTNYTIKDGLYIDGPYLIMGAMCIYEDVYLNMERLFIKLIDEYFGIDNWLNNEIHACDIWAGNPLSYGMEITKRRKFFDDFLQLCGSFGLPYVFSFNLKHTNQDIENKNRCLVISAHCLLNSIEHKLAEIHQTGVLICDASSNSNNLKTKDIIALNIKNKYLTSAQALLLEFHQRTSWRSRNIKSTPFMIPPKYPIEAMSAYLIDRVHFLHSDDSLFLQMCDIMTFIVQRSLVHDYLLLAYKKRLNPDKIPVTYLGWSMMKDQIVACQYDHEACDVSYVPINSVMPECLLFDFSLFQGIPSEIRTHYAQMQEKVK